MSHDTLSKRTVKEETTKAVGRPTARKKTEQTITLLLSEARQIQKLCDDCGISPNCFAVLDEVFTLLCDDHLALQEKSMVAHCIDFLTQKFTNASSDDAKLYTYGSMLRAVKNLCRSSRMIENGFKHLSNIDEAAAKLGTLIRQKCHAVDDDIGSA